MIFVLILLVIFSPLLFLLISSIRNRHICPFWQKSLITEVTYIGNYVYFTFEGIKYAGEKSSSNLSYYTTTIREDNAKRISPYAFERLECAFLLRKATENRSESEQ